jgi:hypothetical protein
MAATSSFSNFNSSVNLDMITILKLDRRIN